MIYTISPTKLVDKLIGAVDCCPWQAHAGYRTVSKGQNREIPHRPPMYTAEQRRRRDVSRWTLVQGILAPLQFVAFLVSLVLVLQYLLTGDGYMAATYSIIIKTGFLYAIMVSGSLWERDVYGQYLFARPFFWEDVVSILVIALHTAYLVVLIVGGLSHYEQMMIALAAYAAYLVNAIQFVVKLHVGRNERLGAMALEGTSTKVAK